VVRFERACVVPLLILASACCGNGSPTAPTPRPSPPSVITSTFHLTGIAADDDGGPVGGATVTVGKGDLTNAPSGSGVTDGRGFYSIDFDAVHIDLPGAALGWVMADSPGHDRFWADIHVPGSGGQNVSQNLRLYRIKRVTAGESTLVTVVPDDKICGPDGFYRCRSVHVVVPADGLLTMEVGNGLALVVDDQRDQQPSSATFRVTAGTEEVVDIGMDFRSTFSQSGVFKTSLAPISDARVTDVISGRWNGSSYVFDQTTAVLAAGPVDVTADISPSQQSFTFHIIILPFSSSKNGCNTANGPFSYVSGDMNAPYLTAHFDSVQPGTYCVGVGIATPNGTLSQAPYTWNGTVVHP